MKATLASSLLPSYQAAALWAPLPGAPALAAAVGC